MPDTFPGDGFERLFIRNLPFITQSLAHLISSRRGDRSPFEQLASDILRQGFEQNNLPNRTPPFFPSQNPGRFGFQQSAPFRPSRGQSMAQLAAMLTRASRRYL